MAGKIIADTLEHSTAGSVTTDYVVNGIAKAWVKYNGTGTIAIDDSLNVTSLTDSATGQHSYTFTNNMSSTDFTHLASAGIGSSSTNSFVGVRAYGIALVTSGVGNNTHVINTAAATYDASSVASSNHGDLA